MGLSDTGINRKIVHTEVDRKVGRNEGRYKSR